MQGHFAFSALCTVKHNISDMFEFTHFFYWFFNIGIIILLIFVSFLGIKQNIVLSNLISVDAS
jgi:hypothetical protein